MYLVGRLVGWQAGRYLRSVHVTLHIVPRGCPVRVDPCRGSHMLRQTEKGVQSELGRSQGQGHEDDVVVVFVGVGGGMEGCMDCSLHGGSQRAGTGERKHSWGRLDTIYCMRPARRVRLSSGCQTSDTCQRRGLLSPQLRGRHGKAGRTGQDWAGMERGGRGGFLQTSGSRGSSPDTWARG